jgi:LPXTG-site transpeptidase (sortase) family protein
MHDIMASSDLVNSSNFTFAAITHVASCNHGTAAANNPQISSSGGTIRWDLGDVRNTGATAETITLTYRVVVLDVGANIQNVTLDNDVDWTWTAGRLDTRAAPSLRIIEPDLQIEKTVDPEVAALGSTITYSIEIGHTLDSLTTAYDVRLTDGIPTGLVLDESSVTVTGSATLPTAVITTDPTQLSVFWREFPLGATATVTFEAEFVGPSPVFNTANVEWSSLQIDPALPLQAQSGYNPFSTERRYDPLSQTVNDYTVASTVEIRVPRLPQTGFAPGKMTVLPQQPADFSYLALGDLWLEIPRLGVNVDIVGVPFKVEDWNLTWLGDQAGYLAGTAYPTHAGNTGITAHAYLADGRPGPFVDLNKLRYGDQVIVHIKGQRYIYEVRENKLVRPNDPFVLKHEEHPWLTLITCKTYNEVTGDYQFRVVVRAVLVKVETE